MMQTALIILIWALAAIVCVASVCRLTLLQKGEHKVSWVIMYLFYGAFAIDTAFSAHDLLKNHDAHTFIGLIALVLNVLITQSSWSNGAPKLSEIDKQ